MADRTATPERFFAGSPEGLAVFQVIADAAHSFGAVELRVSKSQIAFRNRSGFAYVWRPARYLQSDVPAVLSIALERKVESPRFKDVVRPTRRMWMHHIEVWEPDEVDEEVADWLREAYESAG